MGLATRDLTRFRGLFEMIPWAVVGRSDRTAVDASSATQDEKRRRDSGARMDASVLV